MQDACDKGAESAAVFGGEEEGGKGRVVGETIEDVYVCSADLFFIVFDVEGKEIGQIEGAAEGAEHVDFVWKLIICFSSSQSSH